MGIFFNNVAFIVSRGLLGFASVMLIVGCSGDSSSQKKSDDLQVSNVVQEVLNRFNACDKTDAEQNISQESIKNVVQVEDEIENADLQFIRCDGTVSKDERGPIRRLEMLLPATMPELAPKAQMSESSDQPKKSEVQYVLIENSRTCSSLIVPLRKDIKIVDKPTKTIDVKEMKEEEKPFQVSGLLEDGKLQFKISDSNLKLKTYLNVKEGNNVLKMTFFGACHEFKNSQSNVQDKDFEHCLRAEEIAVKEVLLQVKIKRTEGTGIYTYDICEDK